MNNNLNNESTSIYDELRSIHEELRDVASLIHELKNDYEVLEEKIELNLEDIVEIIYQKVQSGEKKSEAIKNTAKEHGINKKEVYSLYHEKYD